MRFYLCPICGMSGLDNPEHLCLHHEQIEYWPGLQTRGELHKPERAVQAGGAVDNSALTRYY